MTHAAVAREPRSAAVGAPASARRGDRFSAARAAGPCVIDSYRGGDLDYAFHGETAPAGTAGRLFAEPTTARDVAAWLAEGPAPGAGIAIGGATDPYPPLERRHGRTRAILELLSAHEGLAVTIATKSSLVTRDLDLLVDLAARHRLAVHVLIPTPDRRLAAALERGAPRTDLRLKAVSELSAAGVPVGVRIAPVLPGITDDPGALDALAGAAAGAGAIWLDARPLLLPPRALAVFFPHLAEPFPDLVERYRERYAGTAMLPEVFARGVGRVVAGLRRKHGLGAEREDMGRVDGAASATPRGPQLDLF